MAATDSRPIVSVRFSPAGRVQSFLLADAGPLPPAGTTVLVRQDNGQAVGVVETPPAQIAARRPPAAERSAVVTRASAADVMQRLKQEQQEREARQYAVERIRAYRLEMKLSRVEYVFDGSKMIFYFTAETRIDFRDLVRDLAARFRMRVELRQIGVRDEAKMLGGYGSCGRPLCCTTWLNTFEPVTIKMAKQQDLSLNPSKLSGLCGRLKCCLRYELPNSKGVRRGGCGEEGGCKNPTGCGTTGAGGRAAGSGCGSGCSCRT